MSSQFEDVGRDDPLRGGVESSGDPLNVPPSAEPDATGLDGILDVMGSARQVYNAARIARFTEDQAFQFARDYFTTMMRMSTERSGQ